MGKVLVKSAMYQYQMGPDGLQRYYTLGGSGRRAQPGEVRGRTKRDRALGLTGAVAGGLFGLAGESRSAGGFAGNIISGAEQGSRFGRGLANLATSRRRQELANLQEQSKIDRAKEAAQRDFQRRQALNPERLAAEGPRLTSLLNPMNINRRRFEAEQGRLQQARETNQRTLGANEQLGRDLASLGRAKFQQEKRRGRRRDDDPAVQAVRNIDPEKLQAAQRVLANVGIEAPQQQAQAPQQVAPLSSETQNQITQGDTQPPVDAPFADHDSEQNSAGQVGEGEMPESGDGEPSRPTSTRMGRLGDREQDLFNEFMQREANNE